MAGGKIARASLSKYQGGNKKNGRFYWGVRESDVWADDAHIMSVSEGIIAELTEKAVPEKVDILLGRMTRVHLPSGGKVHKMTKRRVHSLLSYMGKKALLEKSELEAIRKNLDGRIEFEPADVEEAKFQKGVRKSELFAEFIQGSEANTEAMFVAFAAAIDEKHAPFPEPNKDNIEVGEFFIDESNRSDLQCDVSFTDGTKKRTNRFIVTGGTSRSQAKVKFASGITEKFFNLDARFDDSEIE